ncbi:MAG: AI-2E family transporter [Campylobacterota bacterium]|nr:AI-2E family transporter [Campylobacterota bacterium]
MNKNRVGYTFIVMASVVIVLAGIKSASTLLVPFLLSLFIAIILSPSYNYFKSKGLHEVLSLLLVISIFMVFIGLVVKLIGNSVNEFTTNIDMYSQKLTNYYLSIASFSEKYGIVIPIAEFSTLLDSKRIMIFGTSVLQSMGSMFTDGFVIMLTVIFMLLESSHFVNKINLADGKRDTISHIKEISKKIKHYMVLKALMSLITGFIIWISLVYIGTDYAFLWGVMAFLFNFIPNIGSIIAAVPAVIITLVQLGSVSALFVTILYVTVNTVVGSIIEPKIMGKGLGLSTLVVFLSLLFWGWLLGIIGMLLSIPLTIMAKIAFDANSNTKWIAVLLGTGENIETNENVQK